MVTSLIIGGIIVLFSNGVTPEAPPPPCYEQIENKFIPYVCEGDE